MKQLFAMAVMCFFFSFSGKAQQQPTENAHMARLSFINKDTVYDFGSLPIGDAPAQYQFEFKNTGSGDLQITGIQCAIPGVNITWPHKALKAGKKGIITVSVPTTEIGSFQDHVYITSNATPAPYPFLHISGGVVPAGEAPVSGKNPASKGRSKRH